jgi:L-ribulose-5-phosphate 4-epimerase
VSEAGSVKFICQQVPVEIGAFAGFAELNEYRRKLRELGLIGVDANGVGFGNLSIRDGATSRFYITGSATGRIADLIPSDYVRVVAYDFAKNWLRCKGPTVASSESLTHAAVYESDPTVFSVIHGHDVKLWAAFWRRRLRRRRRELNTGHRKWRMRFGIFSKSRM